MFTIRYFPGSNIYLNQHVLQQFHEAGFKLLHLHPDAAKYSDSARPQGDRWSYEFRKPSDRTDVNGFRFVNAFPLGSRYFWGNDHLLYLSDGDHQEFFQVDFNRRISAYDEAWASSFLVPVCNSRGDRMIVRAPLAEVKWLRKQGARFTKKAARLIAKFEG